MHVSNVFNDKMGIKYFFYFLGSQKNFLNFSKTQKVMEEVFKNSGSFPCLLVQNRSDTPGCLPPSQKIRENFSL